MHRNAEVIELILQKAGRALARTRLLKIAYMTDLFAWEVLGRPISTFEYRRWAHGPFDKGFYDALEVLEAEGRAEERETTTADGYDCTLVSATRPDYSPAGFAPEEIYLVELAVCKFATIPIENLLDDVVYQTEPLKNAERGQRLHMEALRFRERDRAGGVSLQAILESRAAFARGEGISIEAAKQRILGASP